MRKIGLMSDTHSFFDPKLIDHFSDVDEIWHAGDIGSMEVIEKLKAIKPVKAVYGNIDGGKFRREFPLDYEENIEGINVWMTHIGGYPGRYHRRVAGLLQQGKRADLFICGHSHICKVMRDQQFNMLTMNPGACGNHGFHKVNTILKFEIESGKIENLRVVELGRRGRIEQ